MPVRPPDETEVAALAASYGMKRSAALVASGEVDLAVGGDQGGSIRMPRPSGASSATSPRTAWCPTPARSPSS